MSGKCIMVGCDLHERTMLLMIATGKEKPQKRSFRNTPAGRSEMIAYLRKRSEAEQGARVVFAYEAGCLGFTLYDELTAAGFTCHVLAPSKLDHSGHDHKNKTDEKDARRILKALRAHLLGGEDLPAVWVPDLEARADRALVRLRLSLGEEVSAAKARVQSWLKIQGFRKPAGVKNWTQAHRRWLAGLAQGLESSVLGSNRLVLESLLRQLESLEAEALKVETQVSELADQPRYAEPVRALAGHTGIGILSAMVYLTEMGDLSRFSNRRQIGAYVGLVPSAFESGEADDRKGHITRQGPGRVRKVLCQAVWSRIQHDDATRDYFAELERVRPKRKKVAVVAHMRKLAIRLWHKGLEAQQRVGSFVDGPRLPG